MAGTHWIVEGRIDPRWPINTRGNIGEVFPEVLTPLSYTLGVLAAETGWRDAYRQIGILQRNDFKNDDPVIIGLYAGYGYLNISYLRMIGVRAPGSSPEAIDATVFGEGNPPPYVPRKGDKSLLSSLKILLTVIKALGDRFSVREYHNRVLQTGTVPLNLLERQIDAWIASEQKA